MAQVVWRVECDDAPTRAEEILRSLSHSAGVGRVLTRVFVDDQDRAEVRVLVMRLEGKHDGHALLRALHDGEVPAEIVRIGRLLGHDWLDMQGVAILMTPDPNSPRWMLVAMRDSSFVNGPSWPLAVLVGEYLAMCLDEDGGN